MLVEEVLTVKANFAYHASDSLARLRERAGVRVASGRSYKKFFKTRVIEYRTGGALS
jgi:hypothetical protein